MLSVGLYVLASALVGVAIWMFMKKPSSDATPEQIASSSKRNKIVAGVSLALGVGSAVGGYFLGKKKSSSGDSDDSSSKDEVDAEIDSL